MLKDVEPDGGCLGLVPGSHMWAAGGPPQDFVGGNMGALPGHVRCAVPAGAMIMFDMRTWCVSHAAGRCCCLLLYRVGRSPQPGWLRRSVDLTR